MNVRGHSRAGQTRERQLALQLLPRQRALELAVRSRHLDDLLGHFLTRRQAGRPDGALRGRAGKARRPPTRRRRRRRAM